jgi:DNA-3-methyladenine glycosylase
MAVKRRTANGKFLVYPLREPVLLTEDFYRRDTVTVARALLGKTLVSGGVSGVICEVEAYLGAGDGAAHAARGITERTKVIYGPPGRAYVYLIYGMHNCLNLIAEPDGTPGCVLIRGVTGVSGPGRLTRHFGITRAFNAATVFEPSSPLRVFDTGLTTGRVEVTPRIGISKAVDWPLRFVAPGLLR